MAKARVFLAEAARFRFGLADAANGPAFSAEPGIVFAGPGDGHNAALGAFLSGGLLDTGAITARGVEGAAAAVAVVQAVQALTYLAGVGVSATMGARSIVHDVVFRRFVLVVPFKNVFVALGVAVVAGTVEEVLFDKCALFSCYPVSSVLTHARAASAVAEDLLEEGVLLLWAVR